MTQTVLTKTGNVQEVRADRKQFPYSTTSALTAGLGSFNGQPALNPDRSVTSLSLFISLSFIHLLPLTPVHELVYYVLHI